MSDEMQMSSDAMQHADDMVDAFSKRLYDEAFRRAERDGRKTVEIADVDAVAAELAGVSADKPEPVAWAVYADSFGDDGPAVCKHREVSERLANEVGGRLVPLWASDFAAQAPDFAGQPPDIAEPVASQRPFSLTDAERASAGYGRR